METRNHPQRKAAQHQRQSGGGSSVPRQVGKQEQAEPQAGGDIEPTQHVVHGPHCSVGATMLIGWRGES
jgi:hypothetical protein